MNLYSYHPTTRKYIGVVIADHDQLQPGAFLSMTNTKKSAPPDTGINEVSIATSDDSDNDWYVAVDYSGTVYYLPDGTRHEISDIGITPPPDALSSKPTLPEDLLIAVDSERNLRWRGGFPVEIGGVTKWFHSDEFSLTQHLGLKDKARDLLVAGGVMTDNITIAGQPVYWSTMDGQHVQITAQVAFDIVAGGALNQALIFAAAQAHEAAINAATDLDNYDVLAGWPAAFVG